MIRRKKLFRLGLVPKKTKSREERKHEKMLQDIANRVKQRKKDPKYQEQIKQDWLKNYSESFKKSDLQLRTGWANGTTAKKSVFEPVRLDKLDLEEINAKRKANNIDTPIEKAAIEALEQAKEKAKRVAVICHKSGYQYIGEGKDSKDYGKKTSQME